MSEKASQKRLVVTYTKSAIGYEKRQRGSVRALGLHRLGDVVEHDDTPVIRGMINKVRHLVAVEERAA